MRNLPLRDEPRLVRLERGRFLGIRPNNYQCLAEAVVSASELASIEATLLEPWRTVSQGQSVRFTAPLLVVQGRANDYGVWRVIVSRMLQDEGL